ncbi:hypothetical protein AAY473_040347 [Plecturocebus cupreus]
MTKSGSNILSQSHSGFPWFARPAAPCREKKEPSAACWRVEPVAPQLTSMHWVAATEVAECREVGGWQTATRAVKWCTRGGPDAWVSVTGHRGESCVFPALLPCHVPVAAAVEPVAEGGSACPRPEGGLSIAEYPLHTHPRLRSRLSAHRVLRSSSLHSATTGTGLSNLYPHPSAGASPHPLRPRWPLSPSSAPLAATCTSRVTTSVDLRHLQGAAPSDPLALFGSCLSRRNEGHTADGSPSPGPFFLASAQSDVPQSLGDVQPDPQERLACPCLPAAAGPTACVRSCGGFRPWNPPWGGAGGERLWLSLWLLHGHWQVAAAVPFWASVVCPPSCSVPGEERAICRMLEAGACGATAHLNALGGSDGGCRVPGVPFWASVVCPPSCSVPGEERAICRMLEAGACGATAHLNALGGSDGGCRVPRR